MVFALALGAASAPGCRPSSVNRSSRVAVGDAAGGPVSTVPLDSAPNADSVRIGGNADSGGVSGPDSGPSGAAGMGGPATVDAQRDVASGGSDTAPPPPDTARDLSAAEQTVNALLALTPQNCALKLTRDFPLTPLAGGADAALADTAAICGLNGAVYWVADMDIDCDGRNTPGTRCAAVAHGLDTFAHTANGAALAGSVTPFVVVPGNLTIPGLRAGGVVAVINQLTRQIAYAVFGDTSLTAIGAASPACAERVGINPDPVTGGLKGGRNVVYIAFTSANAVPADIENQVQTAQIGQGLTARFITDNR
jgi:hypothetical protein